MNEARAIIEKKIRGWQQALDQLAARRRKLEDDLVQNDALAQQHMGAIQGAKELLDLLPPEVEPQPEPQPQPEPPAPAPEVEPATADNNPLADVQDAEG